MEEKRKGEIACILWQHYFIKEGLPGETFDGLMRELGNFAKATKIDLDELKVFVAETLKDIAKKITEGVHPKMLGPTLDHRDN